MKRFFKILSYDIHTHRSCQNVYLFLAQDHWDHKKTIQIYLFEQCPQTNSGFFDASLWGDDK